MKFYLSLKILSIFVFLIIISGCRSGSVKEKLTFKSMSVHEENWNESGKNFYKIYLSMRKIDSLSAELNIEFTQKNSHGL